MKVDSKAVGRRVRERREELGWAQERLAEEADCSQSNINWVESGKPKDPRKQALALAEALRLHVNWLLYGTGPREIGPALLSKDEVGTIYEGLSFEGKETVMAAIAAAAKHTKKLKSA